jgi:hypothetical protein
MTRVKVISWSQVHDYHECQSEDGKKHRIDLMVDGSFPDTEPQDLVGKSVDFRYMYPYISIAHDVRIVDEAKTGEVH